MPCEASEGSGDTDNERSFCGSPVHAAVAAHSCPAVLDTASGLLDIHAESCKTRWLSAYSSAQSTCGAQHYGQRRFTIMCFDGEVWLVWLFEVSKDPRCHVYGNHRLLVALFPEDNSFLLSSIP